jgi:GT2 family glycosyltransferase
VGVVGAKLLYPDKTIQHAGVILGMQGHASHVFMGFVEHQSSIYGSVDWYRNYMAVTGACMMLPRSVFEELGGFDDSYQLVFSDIELCIRAVESEYRVVYTPYTRLIHHEGRSRGKYMPGPDLRLGAQHFHEIIRDGDPYYNPNLSYTFSTPVFARPIDVDRIEHMNHLVERLAL